MRPSQSNNLGILNKSLTWFEDPKHVGSMGGTYESDQLKPIQFKWLELAHCFQKQAGFKSEIQKTRYLWGPPFAQGESHEICSIIPSKFLP